jgi:RNA exonuclease 1
MLKPNESEPLPPNKLPALSQMFTYGVPTRAPGDSKRLFSVMTTLLNSPLPEGLRKKKEEEGRKLAGG